MRPRAQAVWHILTPEYPPQRGGVGDYTALLAAALAERGGAVHVWCPAGTALPTPGSVSVHPLPGGFDCRGLWRLGRALPCRGPRVLLLQYVPNVMGWRGTNLLLCVWLLLRSWWHGDDVRILFHEPYFYFARQSLRRNLLAALHRLMAAVLLLAARTAYVATPSWRPLLRRFAFFGRPSLPWLPVCSTIPKVTDPTGVAALRRRYLDETHATELVGSFGTFGPLLRPLLHGVLEALLSRRPDVGVLLIGPGSVEFRGELRAAQAARVRATGSLPADAVSLHLQACTLMLQPYPDGVSCRRTSLLACLAHGLPTVTTTGPLTEPLWVKEAAVAMGEVGDYQGVVAAIKMMLQSPKLQRERGESGLCFYQNHCSLEHAINVLVGRRHSFELRQPRYNIHYSAPRSESLKRGDHGGHTLKQHAGQAPTERPIVD